MPVMVMWLFIFQQDEATRGCDDVDEVVHVVLRMSRATRVTPHKDNSSLIRLPAPLR